MKSAYFRSVIFCLAVLAVLLVTTACSPTTLATTTTSSQTTSPAVPTQSPTSTMVLPAEKLKQWNEEGIYNADTLEEASQVAGFKIAAPAYIPDGFIRSSKFMVVSMGARLPEGMRPNPPRINVDQTWTWGSDRLSLFQLTQANHQFELGNETEVAVIAGHTGQKQELPAEGDLPAKLTFNWSDGTFRYTVFGFLKISVH